MENIINKIENETTDLEQALAIEAEYDIPTGDWEPYSGGITAIVKHADHDDRMDTLVGLSAFFVSYDHNSEQVVVVKVPKGAPDVEIVRKLDQMIRDYVGDVSEEHIEYSIDERWFCFYG